MASIDVAYLTWDCIKDNEPLNNEKNTLILPLNFIEIISLLPLSYGK